MTACCKCETKITRSKDEEVEHLIRNLNSCHVGATGFLEKLKSIGAKLILKDGKYERDIPKPRYKTGEMIKSYSLGLSGKVLSSAITSGGTIVYLIELHDGRVGCWEQKYFIPDIGGGGGGCSSYAKAFLGRMPSTNKNGFITGMSVVVYDAATYAGTKTNGKVTNQFKDEAGNVHYTIRVCEEDSTNDM